MRKITGHYSFFLGTRARKYLIESQKVLKQAVLPSHTISSLESFLTLGIIWLEIQLDKCQSEPKRSLPPKGVVPVFSSLNVSSPPPLIPRGLVFCLWAELARRCLWIYWLAEGSGECQSREAAEKEMLRASLSSRELLGCFRPSH